MRKIGNKKEENEVLVFQAKSGAIELKGDFSNETLWANQSQIAEVFGVDRTVITKHIRNILNDKELDEKVVCAKFAHTTSHGAMPGKTQKQEVTHYNLDIILSVGYRTNSNVAIKFRQWANSVLKSHITKGYSINSSYIQQNYEKFILAINDVKSLLPNAGTISNTEILDLVKLFADTWFSLDSYDKSILPQKGATKKSVTITSNELGAALEELKSELISQKQATELFAQVRQVGNLQNIISNVFQSFGGKDLYPSLELKAANLLYFVIKNHPFVDGNKRSGAFAFIWFLNKAGILDKNKINPQTLTALTILIAESNMKDKERMVGIVLLLLQKK